MGHGGGIYIWFGVRGLGGIGWGWGLDSGVACPRGRDLDFPRRRRR